MQTAETTDQQADCHGADRRIDNVGLRFASGDLGEAFDDLARSGDYFPDPVAGDHVDDAEFRMTDRSLMRLATIAADVGARFAREGVDHDPMAWMLAPRRLFDGRTPLEACSTRLGFCRAAVLHGLRIGLDADPAAIDELLDADVLDGALGTNRRVGPDLEPGHLADIMSTEGVGRCAR